MTAFVLQAINVGIIGLCAVMVVVAASFIFQEQARQGQPRTALLRFICAYMLFCLSLACLNAFVQIYQNPDAAEELASLTKASLRRDKRLEQARIKAAEFHGLIARLPESPTNKGLKDAEKELWELLK